MKWPRCTFSLEPSPGWEDMVSSVPCQRRRWHGGRRHRGQHGGEPMCWTVPWGYRTNAARGRYRRWRGKPYGYVTIWPDDTP